MTKKDNRQAKSANKKVAAQPEPNSVAKSRKRSR
jgi:hypothetical protein